MSEGIDPEIFGTVCHERDVAEARLRELEEPIDPIDLRSFPPVPALSSVPETWRQTFLSKQTECPRSAYLYLKYNGGSWSHPLAGGTLMHRAVEKFVRHIWANGETQGNAETAKDILNETIVESTDLTVPAGRFDEIRAMMYHIAEGLRINPDNVLGVELPVSLDVNGRIVTGTIDFAEMLTPARCLVLDWKSAFLNVGRGQPDDDQHIPTKEEWEGSFQAILYALAMAIGSIDGSPFGLEGVEEFVLKQVHPRTFWESEGTFAYREAVITKEALLDWRFYLEAVVAQVEQAITDWRWPAIQGHHCDYCPASAECPIPADHRNYRGEIRTAEDARRAANLWEAADRRKDELWDALKGYNKATGERIPYGRDLELVVKTIESEKIKDKASIPGSSKKIKGRDALKHAVSNSVEYGVPFFWEHYFTPTISSRLQRRTLTPQEVIERKEKGTPP